MIRIYDFYASSVVANTEKALANRLDPNLTYLTSQEGAKRRLIGLSVKCANTGHVVIRRGSEPIVTICVLLAAALTAPITLDLPIAVGEQVTFGHLSTSGTAYCSVAAIVEETA